MVPLVAQILHSTTGHSTTGHSTTGHSTTGHSTTGHSTTGHGTTGSTDTAQYYWSLFSNFVMLMVTTFEWPLYLYESLLFRVHC